MQTKIFIVRVFTTCYYTDIKLINFVFIIFMCFAPEESRFGALNVAEIFSQIRLWTD